MRIKGEKVQNKTDLYDGYFFVMDIQEQYKTALTNQFSICEQTVVSIGLFNIISTVQRDLSQTL